MTYMQKCPVCGTLNERDIWYMEIGICEDHYFCRRCSYFSDMAYSSYYIGIGDDYPKEYEDKVRELGLKVVPQEAIP